MLWCDRYRIFLSRSSIWPFIVLSGYGLVIQTGVAPLLDVAKERVSDGCTVTGYPGLFDGDYSAWGYWWLILPFSLAAYQFFLRRIVGLEAGDDAPAISVLAASTAPSERNAALRRELWKIVFSPRLFGTVTLLATLLNILDLWTVLAPYLKPTPICSIEHDWSVLALVKATSVTKNWVFNVLAYSQQWIASILALHSAAAIFIHHSFFLKHIYCKARATKLGSYVPIDLEDKEWCSGLKNARWAFNWAIVYALTCGLVTLWSRLDNTSHFRSKIFAEHVKSGGGLTFDNMVFKWYFNVVTDHFAELFSDVGQYILIVLWLLMSFLLAAPTLVKYLPILRRQWPQDSERYVRSFIPIGKKLDQDSMKDLPACFRKQAFWPAGQYIAMALLTIYTSATLNMIFPAASFDNLKETFITQVALMGVSATIALIIWKIPGFILGMYFPRLVRDTDEKGSSG